MSYVLIAVALLGFYLVVVWLKALLDEETPPKTRYCEDCPNGFCTEEPKSADCMKWRREHEYHTGELRIIRYRRVTPWFHSIETQELIDQIMKEEKNHDDG